MTIKENVERYFELEIPEKLTVLKVVSEEVLEVIVKKQYTLIEAIEFLNNNIRFQEEQENYEVAEILFQIKQILEEKENGL
jgi:hypothetical protein